MDKKKCILNIKIKNWVAKNFLYKDNFIFRSEKVNLGAAIMQASPYRKYGYFGPSWCHTLKIKIWRVSSQTICIPPNGRGQQNMKSVIYLCIFLCKDIIYHCSSIMYLFIFKLSTNVIDLRNSIYLWSVVTVKSFPSFFKPFNLAFSTGGWTIETLALL